MKKIITALLLTSVLLTSCSNTQPEPSLEKLPEDYTLEAAKTDGCIVYEDLDITAGQEQWDAFCENVAKGKASPIRLYFYDTLDPALYKDEHYAELAKDYPKIDVYDLSYDHKHFTLKKLENGKIVEEEYAYLLRSEDESLLPSVSGYKKRIVYFLSDTPDITWMQAVASTNPTSQTEPYRFQRVYCDYIQND